MQAQYDISPTVTAIISSFTQKSPESTAKVLEVLGSDEVRVFSQSAVDSMEKTMLALAMMPSIDPKLFEHIRIQSMAVISIFTAIIEEGRQFKEGTHPIQTMVKMPDENSQISTS